MDDSERSQVKDDLSQEWSEEKTKKVRRGKVKEREWKEEGMERRGKVKKRGSKEEGMERRKVKEWSSLCSRMCVYY